MHENRISDLDIQLEEYRSRQDGWNAGENCAISLMPTNSFKVHLQSLRIIRAIKLHTNYRYKIQKLKRLKNL